jgi:hypothetical protein
MDSSFRYEDGFTADQRTEWNIHATSAMAYVWGRQDAGEAHRDTGISSDFGNLYAMARYLGHGAPLQSAYHEWRETGRVLVKMGDRVVSVALEGSRYGGTHPTVRHIPWTGDFLRYWPGIVKEPANV